MKATIQRILRICSPLTHEPEVPEPPPDLPPGRVTSVPGRGEMFVRSLEGAPGDRTVLLLHGWTASADTTWFPVYPVLAPDHHVLAVDHRGHGRGIRGEMPFSLEACADDAAALLDLLEITGAVVVGYSMGGAVALLLWRRRPDLVTGLVLAGTALEWRATASERLRWRLVTLLDVIMRMGSGDGFVQRYLREAMVDAPEVAPLRAWVGGELKRGYSRDLAAAGRALSCFDARPYASSIDVPCATVVTGRDRLVRPGKQEELARAVGGHLVCLDGDHDAPLVRSKEFAAAVREAVAAVESERGSTTPS
jgi:3-oxoadipate enol-lactonase